MSVPSIPANEADRMRAIGRLDILDSRSEASFDSIVALAGTLAGTPIAAFSVIDRDRQWFKSVEGLAIRETGRDVSFCGHVVAADQELVVADARADLRFADNPLVCGEPNIGFYAGIPVYTPDNFCIGSLCVIDRKPREMSEAQMIGLRSLAALIERELALRTTSVIDPLTQIYNRGHFDLRLSEEWRRSQRTGSNFSVLLIDIDHFKKLNDSLGHQAGDVALRQVAQLLKHNTRRAGDILARYGGEEFVVIAPGTDSECARALAERCREAVEQAALPHPARPDLSGVVTISVGLASIMAAPGDSEQDLLKQADTALYQAKAQGRNRVVAVSR